MRHHGVILGVQQEDGAPDGRQPPAGGGEEEKEKKKKNEKELKLRAHKTRGFGEQQGVEGIR